ncbi:Inner membrane protein [Candidatus Neptunochlamydia vexilliferae]|uniref:Inner membrane protein n=2 Tax=Candidatus Neptunichlamydia vexilliferae TaxID=1651774 RepID=A0ABS0AX78_9BACT|nr:Inner membrane protein [Candidatus Neptunochlamydia vexilliferae]
MQQMINFIVENSAYAPWISFFLILLAGFNIPISIDVIMVVTAFLAATTIPEHTIPLFISVLVGTYFSAWICYWMGRKVGRKLLKFPYFAKLLPEHRLEKMGTFYEKYGLLTLMIGRFIPFGIRNCIFMTTGISQANFKNFIRRDALACTIWASVCFFGFYLLGQNYELLLAKVKMVNLFIFLAFGVTVIAFVWYKKQKRQSHKRL